MTGTEDAARLALSGNLPFIGSGFTREVFFHDNVVYKVETEEGQSHVINRAELNNAMRIRALLPSGVAIPDMSLYCVDGIDVLAMEYIMGEPTGECEAKWSDDNCPGDGCVPDNILSALASLGIYDAASWGNVIHSDDVFYVIDVAC